MNDPSTKELETYDGVLAALGGVDEEVSDMKDFHVSIEDYFRVFKELAREFPEKFSSLFFSQRSGIPYSKELEDILFQLASWRMIQDNNPDYRYFTVSQQIRQLIRNDLVKIYGEEETKKLFYPISRLFRDFLRKK